MTCKIYIVDDDIQMADLLRHLFNTVGLQSELFTTAEAFLAAIDSAPHAVAVVDVRMPGMNGLECQATLQARGIHIPVIFVTAYAEVEMAVRAMQAGAFDFVEKPFNDQLLLETVQNAVKYVEESHAQIEKRLHTRRCLERLTEREYEILQFVVAGKSSNDIGEHLAISAKTVAVHRANMMHKMQADSVAELVKKIYHYENGPLRPR